MTKSNEPLRNFVVLAILSTSLLATAAAAERGSYEPGHTVGQSSAPAPDGYAEDERGQLYQTSFDLQRRFHIGVYDMVRFDADHDSGPPAHSLVVDAGGVHERYGRGERKRRRHRFFQGRLMLSPFEVDALFYSYDTAHSREDPTLWLTTFFGTPRRYDIPISIGIGFTLGKLHYRQTDVGDLAIIDLTEGRLNWVLVQGARVENFLQISTGLGMGIRRPMDGDTSPEYVYPELGLDGRWVAGSDGLTQFEVRARMRWGFENNTSQHWKMGTARLSAERILIAINDQPLSVYVAPQLRYSDFPFADIAEMDYRILAGARMSLFVPTRPQNTEMSW